MALFKFLYANTRNKDMLYAAGMFLPDPTFLVGVNFKNYIFLDQRTLRLFKEKNRNPGIKAVLLDPLLEEAKKIKEKTTLAEKLAFCLFKKYNLFGRLVDVPSDFPLSLADFLRAKGAILSPENPFWPKRDRKSPEEVEIMRQGVKKIQKVFALIRNILADARIVRGKIVYQNKLLTSEFLKKKAELLLIEEGMRSEEGIIISSGGQSALPHHPGSGPISPCAPVICDIFPRDSETGYFVDMTRVFLKGKPSAKLQKMYAAVKNAQAEAIKKVRPEVKAFEIYDACNNFFKKLGYATRGDKGFIHGAGHGVGLDIHEPPFLAGWSDSVLVPGNVLTIEPGLYYPKIGGIRIEDMVYVSKKGCEVLSACSEKESWVIS
ncbi:MAG: M24 family metallopeptidase [bacterium]